MGLSVLRFSARTVPETHLYGLLFAGAALSFCVYHLLPDHLGPAAPLLAIASNATCGWSWLLVRALFQPPEARRPVWPLILVLTMVVAGTVLRYCDDPHALVPRMIANAENLLSSTILLFAIIDPLITDFRKMPPAEQRFRLMFVAGNASALTIGMIVVSGAPAGSMVALWKYPIQTSCAFACVLGMISAVRYRDRNPIPDMSKARRRVRTAAEDELGDRLISVMKEEILYSQPELSVAGLADRLGEADYKVTQCITGALGFRNFNQMVNRFRIEEAKRRLTDPACDHLPVLTIALDCGFGSIGPFNRAFKTEVGLTPTEFRKAA